MYFVLMSAISKSFSRIGFFTDEVAYVPFRLTRLLDKPKYDRQIESLPAALPDSSPLLTEVGPQ